MNPSPLSRRDALKTLGAGAALIGLGALSSRGIAAQMASGSATGAAGDTAPFTLPLLPYGYDALEPHIDARTMEIHHTKHHQAYINNANAALNSAPQLQSLTAAQILQQLPSAPESVRTTLRNNLGGHVNHAFFWRLLASNPPPSPRGDLATAIDKSFGSLETFKSQFADAAAKRFGSGWAWLSVKNGALLVHSTANQDSPLIDGATPVVGLDVWEHAYYLKYQSARAEYVKAFWNVLNWREAEANYAAAMKSA